MAAGAVRGLGLLLSLLALGAPPAGAVDQPLAGRRLILRQTPTAERLVLAVRDAIVLPLPATSDDPTLVGGQLHVGNPATGEWVRFTLSAAGWFPESPTLYRFTNPAKAGAGSEVRTVVLREGKGIRLRATRLGITLDEPAQGALAVVLSTGTRRYCTLFGGRVKSDVPGRFSARKSAAPAACPEPFPGTVTTTTSRPSSTGVSTTVTTTSTSSTVAGATTSTSTSATSSSSGTATTTSTTLAPSTTSSSTSTSTSTTIEETSTSTSTSSTTSTIEEFTCGGVLGLCSGTCPPGQTCAGVVCTCQ